MLRCLSKLIYTARKNVNDIIVFSNNVLQAVVNPVLLLLTIFKGLPL